MEETDSQTARDVPDITVNKISDLKTAKEQQNDKVLLFNFTNFNLKVNFRLQSKTRKHFHEFCRNKLIIQS